jgi:hypothetical protein
VEGTTKQKDESILSLYPHTKAARPWEHWDWALDEIFGCVIGCKFGVASLDNFSPPFENEAEVLLFSGSHGGDLFPRNFVWLVFEHKFQYPKGTSQSV